MKTTSYSKIERIANWQRNRHDCDVRFECGVWACEELAEKFGLDIFEPRDWYTLGVGATEHNQSLAFFADRVKRVAAVFGPPEKVEGSHVGFQYEKGRAPDLSATFSIPLSSLPDTFAFAKLLPMVWNVSKPIMLADRYPMIELSVRVFSPTGCKVDPRTEFVPAKQEALHPECVSVLKELEDVGSEVSP